MSVSAAHRGATVAFSDWSPVSRILPYQQGGRSGFVGLVQLASWSGCQTLEHRVVHPLLLRGNVFVGPCSQVMGLTTRCKITVAFSEDRTQACMVSLVLVREGAASTKVVQWPRVHLRLGLGGGLRSYILPGPMVRVFVALWPVPLEMGWCFPARGVGPWCARCCRRRARGVPRRRPGRAPCLSCWCCPSWLFRRLRWVVARARGGGGWPRFVPVLGLRWFGLSQTWHSWWSFSLFRWACRFSLHFLCCGVPARWRGLRHVVLTLAASSFPSWRVASGFFYPSQLLIQEAAERRDLRRLH